MSKGFIPPMYDCKGRHVFQMVIISTFANLQIWELEIVQVGSSCLVRNGNHVHRGFPTGLEFVASHCCKALELKLMANVNVCRCFHTSAQDTAFVTGHLNGHAKQEHW